MENQFLLNPNNITRPTSETVTAETTPNIFSTLQEPPKTFEEALAFVFFVKENDVTILFDGQDIKIDVGTLQILLAVELLVAFMGFIANAVMLALIVCIYQTRYVNGIKFIVSVNISSMVALCVIIFRTTSDAVKTNDTLTEVCAVKFGLYYTVLFANMYNRTLAGVDRYLYISKGLKYHNIMTTATTRVFLAITWILSILFGVVTTLVEISGEQDVCSNHRFGLIHEVEALITVFMFPAVLLGVIYFNIFKWAYSQNVAIRIKEKTIKNLILMDDKIFEEEQKRNRSKRPRNWLNISGGTSRSGFTEFSVFGADSKSKVPNITHEQIARLYRNASFYVTFLEKLGQTNIRDNGMTMSAFGSVPSPSQKFEELSVTTDSTLPKEGESSVDPPIMRIIPRVPEVLTKTVEVAPTDVMFSVNETPSSSETSDNSMEWDRDDPRWNCRTCRQMDLDVDKTHARWFFQRIWYRIGYLLYFCCCSGRYYRTQFEMRRHRSTDLQGNISETSWYTGHHIEVTAGTDSTAYHLHQKAQVFDIMRHMLFASRRRAKEIALRWAVNSNFIIRLSKLLLVIFFIYMCNVGLWLPLCIMQIFNLSKGIPAHFVVFKILNIIAIASFMLDPVVFGILNNALRLTIKARLQERVYEYSC